MRHVLATAALMIASTATQAAMLGDLGSFPATVTDTRTGLAPGAHDDYYTFFVSEDTTAIVSFGLTTSSPEWFQPGAFSIELYEGQQPAGVPVALGISSGAPELSFTADLLGDRTYTLRTSFNFGHAGTEVLASATSTVSEIPLPAAAWLFGSALAGLAAVRSGRTG